MYNVIGPDVSFYQDDNATTRGIDFNQMKAAGAAFVIIRAGQNLWPDPDLIWNMTEAKKAGLPRGSYWFFDSRIEPKVQARLYVSSLKGDLGELPLFADFEERYGGPYKGWKNWYTFLEELKTLVNGHEIAIYTGPAYWKEHTSIYMGCNAASLAYFKQYALWIAHYGVSAPTVPAPWTEWTLWQNTDNGNGKLMGVESLNVDMNYFNGDAAALIKRFNLLGGTVTPTPLPDPTPAPLPSFTRMVLYADGHEYTYLVTPA